MSNFPGTPGYEERPAPPPGPSPEEKMRRHRQERFEAIGFNELQAHGLSTARDAKGFFLYWGDAKSLLDRGCPVEVAFDIFSEAITSG